MASLHSGILGEADNQLQEEVIEQPALYHHDLLKRNDDIQREQMQLVTIRQVVEEQYMLFHNTVPGYCLHRFRCYYCLKLKVNNRINQIP